MFVAINQMRYSGKKRKKPEELETQRETEEMEHKENNIIMPTGMAEMLNADEQEPSHEQKEQLAKAPLLRSELCSARALPPSTTTITTTETASTEPASNELTTKGTAEATTAMANEPADIKPTCKWKNCQCNLQSDHHHPKENKHLPHQPEQYAATNNSSEYLHRHPPTKTACDSTRVITSLSTVYLCLGILTLALASLSVLFYSHVTSTSATCQNSTSSSMFPSTDRGVGGGGQNGVRREAAHEKHPEGFSSFALSPSLFRERFRQELLASEHMLHSMVEQILLRQTPDLGEYLKHQQLQYQQPEQQHQRDNHVSVENVDEQSFLTTILTTTKSPVNNNKNDAVVPTTTTLADLDAKDATSAAAAANDNNGGYSVAEQPPQGQRVERKYNGHSDTVAKEPETIEELLKHQKRIRRDISTSPSTSMHDPFIEFFAPSHRKVLEEQDKEIRKRTGLKGAAPGGDDWVYLNTYCRVPEKIITGFCQSTQEYCPASPQGPEGPQGPKGPTGPPGLPGIPGPKGNRGDVGLPGPAGVDGAVGPNGPRGPKGDIGIPGRPGLDGRDGVPGEPGLDGVPGRAGADGIPGKDGIPGRDGKDGQNGKDGKDGAQGPKGSQGPPGERGLKGIAGPRGRVGKPGTDGTPGIPGVNAYKVQLKNGTFLNDLLIPPSIADEGLPHIQRTVVVDEGKTLNLSCGANGNPSPHVEWRRNDGRTININGVEMSSVSGHFLKFRNISKTQMAAYTCYADNGLAPVANATYLVEVHFQPLIYFYNPIIYAQYGRTATLECEVQAFPEAIRYWERASDGKILEPGDKYRIESYPEGYVTRMIVTINHLRKDDFGYYYCTARNVLNVTSVSFEVAPQDPNSETPFVTKERKVEGKMPTEPECPVCEECPDQSVYQCKDSVISNFEVQTARNTSYNGPRARTKNCVLYAVGKPVFHKNINRTYGSWLRDPAAKEADREKTYTTTEDSKHMLYEYTMKRAFRQSDFPRNQYNLTEGFQGNAHIVYNGSFFYNPYNTSLVAKFNLATGEKYYKELPGAAGWGNKLYSTDYNFMDFNVDEIGLWVIYSTNDSNNTLVAMLDHSNLDLKVSYNITLNHRSFGEMFIVCGHLYAIDSCTDKNSQIRYAVDLYNAKLLNVNLPFTNPFTKTTTVGYNPHTVELYSFDRGNALTYPIRYIEEGGNQSH